MIKIISDSTCDLSQEVLERYDIDIIPLHIVKGDEELEDGPQIDIHALYEWADKNKTTPKTSAPSIETAMNVMRPYIDEGREIICFSISSEMSTSINVIRMAAEELDAEDKVTVIDSRNLSTGIGLLVVEAAVMAADGKSREEIKTGIDELIPKVRASFVVDTLVYLYRGGRCNAVSALIGGALALHPMIVVKDGKMDASRKYRGKIGKVIKNYAKDLEEDLKNAIPDRVFITHSECDAKTVEEVRDYIASLGHDFPRLSPEEKLEILKKNHPDYIESGFRTINLGVNKGQKVPLELANLIEAKSRIEMDKINLQKIDYDVDVLIVGAGGAGASAAIEAFKTGAKVMIATKLRFGDANTMMAEGGIQAADKPDDSPAKHYLDVMGGGHFTNIPELVRALVHDAPEAIKWLNDYGVML